MTLIYTKGVSPHGKRVYSLLKKRGALSARKLATLLHTHPSAIYRLVRYLVAAGLAEEISGRPILFRALPANVAKGNYLAYQRDRVENIFLGITATADTDPEPTGNYHISFLQDREAIFAKVAEDLKSTLKKAHFIVLGLPIGVSPELMLEQKNAVERGASIKIIVQELTEENQETIKSWQKQGLQVRQGRPIGFHLLLIDNSISYLMYYDQTDKTKRYAARIIHPAINQELQAIFSHYWKTSRPL